MAKRFIMTITVANRVGILAAVTTALAELKGQIHEISVTSLQKFSTMMIAADFPESNSPEVIRDHVAGICAGYGAVVTLKDPSQETLQSDQTESAAVFLLSCHGHNAPEIARRISGRLAERGVDIADIYAVRQEADGSFLMTMELRVPAGTDVAALETELHQLASAEGWSAVLRDCASFSADTANHISRRLRLGY
jgi:glycine cleavage system transcriptional repressor